MSFVVTALSTETLEWDTFVRTSDEGTPFHLTAWKQAVEQTFGRGVESFAVELRFLIGAPAIGRLHRLPVEIALRAIRRLPDRLRRDALLPAERHALAGREAHPLGAAVRHRLIDRAEIDAKQLRRRRTDRPLLAATEWIEAS